MQAGWDRDLETAEHSAGFQVPFGKGDKGERKRNRSEEPMRDRGLEVEVLTISMSNFTGKDYMRHLTIQFSSVQSLSHVRLVTP